MSTVLPRANELIGPRWIKADGRYELWGWRAEGSYALTAFYPYHGPSGIAVPLPFGADDLALTLPATGWLQCKLACRKPFSDPGAVAVIRDLDGGEPLRRFLIPRDATNIRLVTGHYQVACELNGVVVADFGTIAIEHDRTSEVSIDLRAARVFCIEVVDTAGKPISGARVRVVGSPEELRRRVVPTLDGSKSMILVATTKEHVDLEVSGEECAPRLLEGVRADCVVVLERRSR